MHQTIRNGAVERPLLDDAEEAAVDEGRRPAPGAVVVVDPEREAVTVRAFGEIDLATVDLLATTLADLRQAGFAHVVVDLRGLALLDCAGMNVLLAEARLASREGRRLDLIRGHGLVDRVFDVLEVRGRFTFVEPARSARLPRGR